MSDKPIVGRLGEVPEEEEEPQEGIVLFNPGPRAPAPPQFHEPEPEPEPSAKWPWALAAVVVIGTGAYVGLVGIPSMSGVEEDPSERTMVPSLMNNGPLNVLTPVPLTDVTGPAGSTVRIAVRANGLEGATLIDTLVTFRIERGEGVLLGSEVKTDRDGIARTSLLLPDQVGATVVVASIEGSIIAPARVVAAARPGPPARISLAEGDGQSAEIGELLAVRPSVLVTDARSNPVPDVLVSFSIRSGDGQAAPTRGRTNEMGRVSALWRLGMSEGEQVLVASASGLSGDIVFRASAIGRTRTSTRADPSTGLETDPVTVRPNALVVGGSHVCSLVAGRPQCRGADDRGQTSGNSRGGLVALTSGISHVCGLDREGTAWCWGSNEAGQLGDGTQVTRSTPLAVRTELRFSVLTAGLAHTCGLAGGGVPVCWGLNLSGQLGDGSRNDQRSPRTVGGGVQFRSLVAGWSHTCGLTSSGNAFCWGANGQGQLGDGSQLDRLVPTLVRGSVETLTAGSSHTCGISEQRVQCWGGNRFGQLGDGSNEDRMQPVDVTGLPGAPVALAAGAVHSCALISGGQAYCWGQNLHGQIGDGSTQNRARAVAVAGGLRFSSIHAGGALTCGRTTDGAEYCWGLNQNGQVGDGSRVSRPTPTLVSR